MDEISVDDISDYVFSSKYHFQRVFHLITGVTVGEYIRNRRLSLAGRDLQLTDNKVVDIALKYRYETSESFSKAFSRFHGISPSEVRTPGSGSRLKFFYPLVINVSVQGGFDRARLLIDQFCWNSMEEVGKAWSDSENYHRIISWAGKARGQNPGVFDALTEWLLDDSEWSDDQLAENEQILIQGVLARFRVIRFEYRKMPAMRFIGKPGDMMTDMEKRKEVFHMLDGMDGFRSGFDHDLLVEHYGGLCIDVEQCHKFWGRFMKADTPVPEGFTSLDFVPYDDRGAGPPYISQFAFAVFSGDMETMHKYEGYDRGAMYDVTRNIMLGQGAVIPYPDKYWTAEVFLDGYDQYSTAYLFSAKL